MLCFPNCKINLGLYITRRREDGYHDLETVFYPVPIRDVLEIIPATGVEPRLHISGLPVAGSDENNLVLKAYELLRARFPGKIPAFDIYLHKVIPMGAGLGGGSADGAFMLALLNDKCDLGLEKEQLAELALELGSDCPFFVYNTPQFATGRGEQMSGMELDLSGYSIQLVCPQVHVSTARAFQQVTPAPAAYQLSLLYLLPVEQWKDNIRNDFEGPVFQQYPVLADIKGQLYAQGAIYASMSGSGSALYGIFRKNEKAEVKADVPFEVFYTG
jgi:4-diphosphocytidyl-2-C-methyl-D-erythritol kinase